MMRKQCHNKTSNKKNQGGFTLIEIMISLVISSVLIGGVFATFLNTKQTERFAQALSRMQESGRFGVDYLAREVRMIGYRGCASSSSALLNVIADNAPSGGLASELIGYEVTSDNWWADSQYVSGGKLLLTRSPKKYSDIINIRRSKYLDVELTGNMDSDNANIQITPVKNNELVAGDLIMISDCINGDLFAATTVSTGSKQTIAHAENGNSSNRLSKAYQDNARLYKFSSISYFVADTGRVNNQGDSVYALYQADQRFNTGTFISQEIIEGVENMQILYGVRDANGNINYLNATAVTASNNWANVTTIKLGLMLTSNEGVRQSTDSSSYQLLDVDIGTTGNDSHDTDKRLRQIYTSSIVIRNRQ